MKPLIRCIRMSNGCFQMSTTMSYCIQQMRKAFLVVLLTALAVMKSAARQGPAADFGIRGFYIDLRNEIMTPAALRAFAGELAAEGINTLVMEWEATFPYKNHATISNELAYTREEIASFVGYCSKMGITVIPVQECFGHVEYILRNHRYSSLREDDKDISQLCPLKITSDSLLFADLFADMASLHPSKYIHIGGDETRLLGHCAECRKKVAAEGASKLFVDYMKTMCNIVLKMGKIPVVWADMLLKHPEAAGELPKETILMDWNYGWKTNYFGNISNLQEKGFTFWGASSVRSHPDNWYVTDWITHFNNQKDFIPYARSAGYQGMVTTSWSTSGVYSSTWDVGNEVLDMEPIRNNYPLSGFRMLVALYTQSLKQAAAIDPKAFVVQYAATRFGLTQKEGAQLWQALMLPPELIVQGKPAKSASIAAMRIQNDSSRKLLNGLHPLKNKNEFEHYRLMADLRDYYLAYKEIEAEYNAADFSRSNARLLLPKLKRLMDVSKTLDQRFYTLNTGFLYDSELQKQNGIRNRPVQQLYKRLANIARTNNK